MSFFPGMLTPSEKGTIKCYHMAVNEFGECIVTPLDKDGRSSTFCVAHGAEPLVRLLAAQMCTDKVLYEMRVWPLQDPDLAYKVFGGACRVYSWADAITALNGKEGVRRARVAERYAANYEVAKRFIRRDERGGVYVWSLTDAGMKQEAMWQNPTPPEATE